MGLSFTFDISLFFTIILHIFFTMQLQEPITSLPKHKSNTIKYSVDSLCTYLIFADFVLSVCYDFILPCHAINSAKANNSLCHCAPTVIHKNWTNLVLFSSYLSIHMFSHYTFDSLQSV